MSDNMTNELKRAFTLAREKAVEYGDNELRVEHILYSILVTDNIISEIVKDKVKDYDMLIKDIDDLNHRQTIREGDVNNDTILNFESRLIELLRTCIKNVSPITVDVFFSKSLENNINIVKILKENGVTKSFIQKKIKQIYMSSTFFNDDNNENKGHLNPIEKSNYDTTVLDNFTRDLTKMAKENKLDLVIGRDFEIDRVTQILSRRKKNNPLLIGEPGVGKSSIAEGLAIKIFNNDCPRTLQNKRLLSLDITALVAGTKYRGQFEERVKSLLDEVKNNPNIILFIDELHTIIGAGNSSGALDIANVFKPALASGEVQCIGATTLDEYREHIEKDGALDRRFQKVIVEPTSILDTINILNNIRGKYEDYHNVIFDNDIIEEIVRLADRYITNREFPDKAIDIMDELGSKVQIKLKPPQIIKDLEAELVEIKKKKHEVVKTQKFELAADLRDSEKGIKKRLDSELKNWNECVSIKKTVITKEMLYEVITGITNIPINNISEDELNKLKSLNVDLSNSVIGQDHVVDKISSAIKRNKMGISKKNRPIASFLFVGSTGVGKCHTKGTKILMYNGSIKNVEDVNEGDLIMGDDNTPRKVLSLANGFEDCYNVVPVKGEPFGVNESHILSLRHTQNHKIVNISVKDYLGKSDNFKNLHKLYRSNEIEFTHKGILLEPYLFGLSLKKRESIPENYLLNTIENRRKLLAGLIDGDGYASNNCFEFTTKYKELSEQILFLVRSLGLAAYSKLKKGKYKDGVKDYYKISISGDLDKIPIKVESKKSHVRKQIRNVLNVGFKLKFIGVQEYFGFTLDGNSLYVLGDFTITHNTELAKILSEKIFGTKDSMIRIDMSEYGEKFDVTKLIGAPPGYIGYGEGGQLTEKIKNKPYSLLLFDEIEKAHPDIFNVLLQVLDEGHLTDNSGRKINFKNTIIIMTSNIGSKDSQDFGMKIGFTNDPKNNDISQDVVNKSIKKFFKPEFLNRLDEVIHFNHLNADNILKIVDIQLNELRDRLLESNLTFKITKQVKEKLGELGYDKNYGARELNRVIQKYIENPMSEELLLNNNPTKGLFTITYDVKKEKINVALT